MFPRAALLSILVTLAASAPASIFGADDRLVVSHGRGSPFAPIGVAYDSSSDRYGTAFLVDECHALTAEHLVGPNSGEPQGDRMQFQVGQDANRQFERRTGATVVASGGFTERQWNRDADWLLLKLDRCLGRSFGFVKLHAGGLSGQPLQSAGYPSDRAALRGQLIIDPHCRLIGKAQKLWLHTCAGRAGDSGGPLFHVTGTGLEVVAIQAAAFPTHVHREPKTSEFDPDQPFTGLNEAVPVANIIPVIGPYLDLGPG